MGETMKSTATEEFDENTVTTEKDEKLSAGMNVSEDVIKEAVEEQIRKVQRQNLLLGGQSACKIVLDKIIAFKVKQGKPTMNDYKRLVKDIEHFCSIGLSRKVTADGETVPRDEEPVAEETVQN